MKSCLETCIHLCYFDMERTVRVIAVFGDRYPRLKGTEIIDPVTQFHFAFYKSIKETTDMHRHDFHEMFLIIGGDVVHLVNGERDVLSDGTLVFIRKDDVHGYEKENGGACQLYNLAFSQQVAEDLALFLGEGFPLKRLMQESMPPKAALSGEEVRSLILELERTLLISGVNKQAQRSQLRVLLAFVFTRYMLPRSETGERLPEWMVPVVREMKKKENFSEGLPRLHEMSGRTPEHVSRMFRKHFDTTPTEWINERRLNYAANLLAFSDDDILSISLDCGFQNVSHFYHKFKLLFGVSPKQYRKQHTKSLIP